MQLSSDLIAFWESFDWPCGLKDTHSRFIYINPAYRCMQNLAKSFDIAGRYDGELPTETHEYQDDFQKHDQLVLETNKTKSSIEIHPFGKNKILEGWIFHKKPFLKNGQVEGIFFWAEPAKKLDTDIYTTFGSKPASIILNPPTSTLTDREWEVLFFMLKGDSLKSIASRLTLQVNTVRKYLDNIKDKLGVYSQSQAVDYCKVQGWDHYVPSKYIIRHKMLN
ncbi:helix-turn-helix transcriptional regulator [Vibrio ostreicida]|uniref:LuxR C-terminal-related transcriptional regulator n=1 Tax=Vibrio ostreicida TaxID=526588 RepID=A0ABT8BWI5_9VIBR|nr:LuxR C-terminal-related transcriptional regulator [Vibrio ostreicida]MDN3610761.1 LuxR C-terminal-related transcriptional regulator [Vibrio ostreicida]NPD07243.1 PAS domain-containing protein [Vibrio ostreicida]